MIESKKKTPYTKKIKVDSLKSIQPYDFASGLPW